MRSFVSVELLVQKRCLASSATPQGYSPTSRHLQEAHRLLLRYRPTGAVMHLEAQHAEAAIYNVCKATLRRRSTTQSTVSHKGFTQSPLGRLSSSAIPKGQGKWDVDKLKNTPRSGGLIASTGVLAMAGGGYGSTSHGSVSHLRG